MCKSFRSAPTFAHRSADYIRSCVKALSLSQKPSTHLRIGKIPSGKQAFRGNFANPRFVMCNRMNTIPITILFAFITILLGCSKESKTIKEDDEKILINAKEILENKNLA